MKTARSYIIFTSEDGAGKIYNILVNYHLLGIFLLLIFLCICSVPFFETGLISVKREIFHLKQEKQKLGDWTFRAEIYSNYTYSSITLPEKFQALESNLKILKQLYILKEQIWEFIPIIIPVEMENPRITSKFGWRRNPLTDRDEFHAGFDILGSRWTEIISSAAGVVINRGYDQWLGNYIVIQHTEKLKTIFGHMSKISVANGTKISRGDLLGYIGNTGLSTGTHLHYSILNEGQPVDPMEYILDIRPG